MADRKPPAPPVIPGVTDRCGGSGGEPAPEGAPERGRELVMVDAAALDELVAGLGATLEATRRVVDACGRLLPS
jgi:hypothetical protein